MSPTMVLLPKDFLLLTYTFEDLLLVPSFITWKATNSSRCGGACDVPTGRELFAPSLSAGPMGYRACSWLWAHSVRMPAYQPPNTKIW